MAIISWLVMVGILLCWGYLLAVFGSSFWLGSGVGLLTWGAVVFIPIYQTRRAKHAAQTAQASAKDLAEIEDSSRRTVAQLLGAVLLVVGGYISWQEFAARQQKDSSERLRIATAQLALTDVFARLAAIFELEGVADSPTRRIKAKTVLEALIKKDNRDRPKEFNATPEVEQAVRSLSSFGVAGVHLQDVRLGGAKLQGVILTGADLTQASMWETNLEGADLKESDLRCSDLTKARFKGADLAGADVGGAMGLTAGQVSEAKNAADGLLLTHLLNDSPSVRESWCVEPRADWHRGSPQRR